MKQTFCIERGALVLTLDRIDVDQHHQQNGHDQCRNDAAHEELCNADTRHTAVNNERDRGREDRADDGGGRGDGTGEVLIIAVARHGFHFDCAEAARIRNGGAGHTGEHDACHNVCMAKAAGDPADELFRRVEDLAGDLACIHQVARHDEQRDRDQKERVDTVDHLLADDDQIIAEVKAACDRGSTD